MKSHTSRIQWLACLSIAECSELIGHEVKVATQSKIPIEQLANEIINQINPKARIITKEDQLEPEKSEVFRLFRSNEKLKKHTS